MLPEELENMNLDFSFKKCDGKQIISWEKNIGQKRILVSDAKEYNTFLTEVTQ